MWIKWVALLLFILLFISLSMAAFFLFRDKGAPSKRHLLWSLGTRVTLAVLLLIVVSYGVLTGQLRSQAPWADSRTGNSTQQSAP